MANKTLYHGSEVKFNRFDINKIKLDSNDEEGVGIYFTDDKTEAKRYGKYIYTVELKSAKKVPLRGNMKYSDIDFMINKSSAKVDFLSNYAENPIEAKKMFLELNAKDLNQPHEYFKTLWYELYRYNPIDFVRNMVKLKYDYVAVPKRYSTHYIIYNTNKIKILKIEVN